MKHLFSLLALLIICSTAHAQQDYFKHEVSLSYGLRPILSVAEPIVAIHDGTLGEMVRYDLTNKRDVGTFNLTYLYHLSKSLSVGGTYAYGNVKHDMVMGGSISIATYNSKYHLLMPTVKYEWARGGSFCLYSRVAIGACFTPKADVDLTLGGLAGLQDYVPEQNTYLSFAWQVVPLGIEIHLVKHFALFIEGGAGSSGYGLAGVKTFF
jgi:hypothetical protein